LTYGLQAGDSGWVEGRCWWFVKDLELSVPSTDRVHLVLRGVDYVWDLFLNGHHLGRHEGMFSPRLFDITSLLDTQNRLAVRVTGSDWLPRDRSSRWERFLCHLESHLSGLAGRYPLRRDTLKCQMGFGWDFAPPLRTMGIWDDVYAIATGEILIRDIVTRSKLQAGSAELTVQIEVDAGLTQPARLRLALVSEEGDTAQSVEEGLTINAGTSRHQVRMVVPRPRLWWPWDHGHPHLYRLTVEVWNAGDLLDSLTQSVGIRQVQMDNWQLLINGRRVFARGANWVPADILPGRVSDADYESLLCLARGANMNMLRVWGGGLREKRAFYDLCDRMGILVWQEFPFACAFLARFPRSKEYLRLVDGEARGIVRDLRNHPSVVLWCGGNEFDPARNEPLVAALRRAVAEEDATRPFVPASPAMGDSHNWKVWHHSAPPAEYRDDRCLFASEFGLQAAPGLATLQEFIPRDQLWPPGPAWAYHGAGLKKLKRYARPFLRTEDQGLEEFIGASRRAQAHGLQVAIEHYRRRKADGCGGVLVWQLNEPWPAVSWALVEHARRCKPAYYRVKQLFKPQLVSLDYQLRHYTAGSRFCPTVWVINDAHDDYLGSKLEVSLWDADGRLAEQFNRDVDVGSDSARIAGRFCWDLPASSGWQVTCQLVHQGLVLTTNRYDLAAYDGDRPGLCQKIRTRLAALVTPT
jgi:beta-mannosidase